MLIGADLIAEPLEHPTGVSIGAEEHGAMITVDPAYMESDVSEKYAHLRTDETTGSTYNNVRHGRNERDHLRSGAATPQDNAVIYEFCGLIVLNWMLDPTLHRYTTSLSVVYSQTAATFLAV